MSTEAMQLALEALESDPISHAGLVSRKQAVTALRQALEEKREPVAWISDSPTKGNGKQLHWTKSEAWRWSSNITPLYAAPPRKREWVGLTDEEIDALSQARSLTDELMDCVDRLGSEADTVDPRVWQHLLVYAPKPEEEPVAWITNGGKGELWWYRSSKFDEEGNLIGPNPDDIPLYTAPPKKQWVGLTLNEAEDFYEKYTDKAELINAIDRFLEEKNA